MDTLGIEATPEEVDLMIDEIDQDNNGEIDFEGTRLNIHRALTIGYLWTSSQQLENDPAVSTTWQQL